MLIVTIHGLGGSSFNHWFWRWYLQEIPNSTVISFNYSPKTSTVEDILSELQNTLNAYKEDEIVLIGHSLGGIIATLALDPRITKVITISSPHMTSSLAKTINDNVPLSLSKYIFGEVYDLIVNPPGISRIPKIICIVTSLHPWTSFDGQIYSDEMIHPQACKVYKLDFSEHITQVYDPRMAELLVEITKKD